MPTVFRITIVVKELEPALGSVGNTKSICIDAITTALTNAEEVLIDAMHIPAPDRWPPHFMSILAVTTEIAENLFQPCLENAWGELQGMHPDVHIPDYSVIRVEGQN
ncbi:hypothetical protein N7499_012149 [Penicillium canescens]|uniref:Uncharacterized protein n=1 Tax=Penicillium canescens TaxID=5083 RepID=A0AAD6IFV8_PENCN|nr:uncharacterized protein N7446_003371 [Penicillium canescens]KAJ5996009.1 hypothetical protein N7522_007669 [Penicillium canescens]KAJ6045169.1 hypothetical protein N7460_006524 [Penicillium canescens]KAJ6056639.1 hypothetical protein N7444_005737 [Penicillium canescens]KAJ6066075.1 hypothetical protein N7499_012149 [Penicillium canescens]KAJ6075594.1 hypothetical protein N7446_003371 [Penicillium canescens]